MPHHFIFIMLPSSYICIICCIALSTEIEFDKKTKKKKTGFRREKVFITQTVKINEMSLLGIGAGPRLPVPCGFEGFGRS